MRKLLSIILSAFILPAMLFISGCGKNPPEGPSTPEDLVYEISADGKYVYFGEYPQTIKDEDVTITSDVPDVDGYYLGSDGERYLKHIINLDFDDGYWDYWILSGFATLSNNHTYAQGEELYFKIEKLKWRILSKNDESLFLVCDTVVKSSTFQTNSVYSDGKYYLTDDQGDFIYQEDGTTKNYANNYKYSIVRKFLTEDFYHIAFSAKEKEIINLTEVDNSAQTTNSIENKCCCENTSDYIFALSYQDMIKEEYGFSNDAQQLDSHRFSKTSDYARATGVEFITEIMASEVESLSNFVGMGLSWLRSPHGTNIVYPGEGYTESYSGRLIYNNLLDFDIHSFSTCWDNTFGVVPALYLNT